jgi:predicted dehydrogenase
MSRVRSPVRVGIVGVGAIGNRILRAFSAHPHTEIAAVCDTDKERAAAAAGALGGIPWFASHRALLEQSGIDLVYIAVPPRWHHQVAVEAIAAGRHVLCEKPLALTLADAREMTARAESAGVVHAVNLGLIYAPGVRAFRARVAAGYVGELRRIEITLIFPEWPRAWQMNAWVGGREQGGPVRECGPHLFHLVLAEFGAIVRVWADMEYPDDPARCESSAAGLFELAGGQRVLVNVLCHVPRPETVSLMVHGSRATVGLVDWVKAVGATGPGPLAPLPPAASDEGASLVTELVRAIGGDPADLVGFEQGLALQRVQDAWDRAVASGGWVDVDQAR